MESTVDFITMRAAVRSFGKVNPKQSLNIKVIATKKIELILSNIDRAPMASLILVVGVSFCPYCTIIV